MPDTIIAQHTPGPWQAHIGPRIGNYAGAFSIEVPGFVICGRAGVPQRATESNANASLIAAAPELLVVCRRFLEMYDDVRYSVGPSVQAAIEHAERAIAKAEGRS
jgi:hypothetical protein